MLRLGEPSSASAKRHQQASPRPTSRQQQGADNGLVDIYDNERATEKLVRMQTAKMQATEATLRPGSAFVTCSPKLGGAEGAEKEVSRIQAGHRSPCLELNG